MTNRERWIVYPLLFLTLGISMRDKVFPPWTRARQVDANLVRCNKLEVGRAECRIMEVARPDGTPGVRIGVLPDRGGWLQVCSRNGRPVVVAGTDPSGLSGVVETLDSQGVPQVQLLPTPYGGAVTTVRYDKSVWVVMGHAAQTFGLFADFPELGRRLPLTWVLPVAPKPTRTAPPQKPAGTTSQKPAGTTPQKPAGTTPQKPDDPSQRKSDREPEEFDKRAGT